VCLFRECEELEVPYSTIEPLLIEMRKRSDLSHTLYLEDQIEMSIDDFSKEATFRTPRSKLRLTIFRKKCMRNSIYTSTISASAKVNYRFCDFLTSAVKKR
jgi:hypothetical protein